jgi:hypothetical protein
MPAFHVVAAPLSPTTTHEEPEAHETEYANALLNIGIRPDVHVVPLKVASSPDTDTAMQNARVTHETEISFFGPDLLPAFQLVPLNVRN